MKSDTFVTAKQVLKIIRNLRFKAEQWFPRNYSLFILGKTHFPYVIKILKKIIILFVDYIMYF